MKRNLLIRLCLMTIAWLSLQSCRQEILPEQENYNNSGAFQLISKRISLSEAKHKTKLLPELEQVENKFKAKGSAFGKTVNYGNGVSIDTDDVIYIENGPNYYTYTFRINRENASANAPVENLILSPLSDGTYREILVSYNLTSQEKQQLENGLFVDLTGKVISQELASGTYGTNLMGKTTSTQCNWQSATVNVKCPCEGHTLGQQCTCTKGKPKQYVITWNVCEDIEDSTPAAGSPASGGGGGTGTLTPPCNENGISSQPQNPDSTLENQPCNNGTVTLPNLGFNPMTNTCEKIKEQNTTDFKNKVTALKSKLSLKYESGYVQNNNGSFIEKTNASATEDANSLTLGDPTPEMIAFLHTHPNDYIDSNGNLRIGFKIFSPADVIYFNQLVKQAHQNGIPLANIYAVMVSGKGNYQIRFTGNVNQIKTTYTNTKKQYNEMYKTYFQDNNKRSDELNFLKFIDEHMYVKGVSLVKMNDDGTFTTKTLNADKTEVVDSICPE